MQEVNTSRLTSAAVGGGVLKSPNLVRGGSLSRKSPWERAEKMEDNLPGAGRGDSYGYVEREEWHFSGCGRLWAAVGEQGLPCRLQKLKLVLGLHNLHDPQDPGLSFYIREAIKHPAYNHKYENDLALLKLDGQVQPSKKVKPLALPRKSRARPAEGTQCSTAGWGRTRQDGHLARALQELDLRVLDTRMCNNSRFWNGVLVDSMLCLKAGTKSQAPCKGDSGGPLVCGKGQVVGILSFSSKNCTDIFKPPVATAVAPYISWIRKVIGRWSPQPLA